MKRIFLFLVTNLAVLALLSGVVCVVERIFGLDFAQGGLGTLLLLPGMGASVIVSWYSRPREFRADRGGATLAGVDGMVDAPEAFKRRHDSGCCRRCRPSASTPAVRVS